MNITSQIKQTLTKHRLIKKGDCLLVGFSGGPDSTVLLHLLHSIRHEYALKLMAVHVNHRLRAGASSDEKFAENFCRKLNVPIIIRRATITKRPGKSSIEELARERRLKILVREAEKTKAKSIVLGHHKDDLAETVLMRIVRGSGLKGLRAIRYKTVLHNQTVIRPLLDLSRDSILRYIKKHRLSYCTDPTNTDTKLTRNKIRHHLLPELSKNYNPRITDALANLAQTAGEDYDYLDQEAQRKLKRLAQTKSRTHIQIPLESFTKLAPSLQHMLLRLCVEKLKGDTNRLENKHLTALTADLNGSSTQTQHDWPQGLTAKAANGVLTIRRRKT